MKWDEFFTCCGLAVIYNLSILEEYNHATNGYTQKWKSVHEGLKAMEEEAADAGYPYVLAASVPKQREAVKALKKRDWEALKRFKNPNSGNFITLWIKKIR